MTPNFMSKLKNNTHRKTPSSQEVNDFLDSD